MKGRKKESKEYRAAGRKQAGREDLKLLYNLKCT